MISAGELIYSQPRSAVQTGSPSQQTYWKRERFLTGSGRGPAKFFGDLRARNFMKPPFKNPTSATVESTDSMIWCSLKSLTTTLGLLFSWLHIYTALHSSYHIGEPSLIPKLLLPCVYDTMIMQFYY